MFYIHKYAIEKLWSCRQKLPYFCERKKRIVIGWHNISLVSVGPTELMHRSQKDNKKETV